MSYLDDLQAMQDKVDSPELLAYFQQFGLERYIDAQNFNLIKNSLIELFNGVGPGAIQNNTTKWMSNVWPFDEVPNSLSVANYLNTYEQFTVTPTDSRVYYRFLVVQGSLSYQYLFDFGGGKGKWGSNSGGAPNILPVAASNIKLLAVYPLVVADIEDNDKTIIVPLGELSEDGFLAAANTEEHDFTDTDLEYYFSYYIGEVLYLALFIGAPDIYGGGLGSDNFVNADFAQVTNSDVTPVPPLQITSGLPKDFFISCNIDSSLLNYKTDTYRTFDLQPYMPLETVHVTSQILRISDNDITIIANSSYGYVTVITLYNCKIVQNVFTVEQVAYGRVTDDASGSAKPDKYRVHGALFNRGFVYLSTRPDDNGVTGINSRLIKVNPYDISNYKTLEFPISNDSYKYQTTEIRAYKNYIYLLFARGGSSAANLVRVDENLNNPEVVFQLGGVSSLKRINRESTFLIYNDEIYVPTVNNVSAPNAYNTVGISVYSMTGVIKREVNLIDISGGTNVYTSKPYPHWMAVFNGKLIISFQLSSVGASKVLVRFDINTLAFEEILNTPFLITHRNSIFTDGYMYLNGEFYAGFTTATAQLWKVKFNNFLDKTVEISNYNGGFGSYGSIEPLVNTESLVTNEPTTKIPETTYIGAPIWNGTPPTGMTGSYRAVIVSKTKVELWMNLVYSVVGAANTTLTIPLPAGLPNPSIVSVANATNDYISPCEASLSTGTNVTPVATRGYLRKISGGYGINMTVASAAYTVVGIYVTYMID